MKQHADIARDRQGVGEATGLGLLGARFGLLAVLAASGCGIGTEPGLSSKADGAGLAAPDSGSTSNDAGAGDAGSADGGSWSTVPEGIPPIDQMSYQQTATATFALG